MAIVRCNIWVRNQTGEEKQYVCSGDDRKTNIITKMDTDRIGTYRIT